MTSGPEADIIEALAVLLGIVFIAYGLAREKANIRGETK